MRKASRLCWARASRTRASGLVQRSFSTEKPVIVLHPFQHRTKGFSAAELRETATAKLHEAESLASTLGWRVVGRVAASTRAKKHDVLGPGQVTDLKAAVHELGAEAVYIDAPLSAIRTKYLRTALGCSVVDRRGVILSIFEQNAKSREAKIQVRLARLQYERARLVLSSSEFRFD